jgi:hypothetical protein
VTTGGTPVVELTWVELLEVLLTTVVVLLDDVWFALDEELTADVLFELSPTVVVLEEEPTMVALRVELLTMGMVELLRGRVEFTPTPGKVELLPKSGILVPLLVLLFPETIEVLLLVLF